MNANSMEVVLIHASLKLLHLELGIISNLFDLPYNCWSFLATSCCLKSLWQFVNVAQIWLDPLTSTIGCPPQLMDRAIMEDVMLTNLPKNHVLAINCC